MRDDRVVTGGPSSRAQAGSTSTLHSGVGEPSAGEEPLRDMAHSPPKTSRRATYVRGFRGRPARMEMKTLMARLLPGRREAQAREAGDGGKGNLCLAPTVRLTMGTTLPRTVYFAVSHGAAGAAGRPSGSGRRT